MDGMENHGLFPGKAKAAILLVISHICQDRPMIYSQAYRFKEQIAGPL